MIRPRPYTARYYVPAVRLIVSRAVARRIVASLATLAGLLTLALWSV